MRISWLAIVTNELTLPNRSSSSRRQRIEVRVGERAERHGQDVELACLDERQQKRERALELGQLDLGRGLGSAALAEATAGARHGVGAAMTGTPTSTRADAVAASISWPRPRAAAARRTPASRGASW